jgi:Carboxypeptidase regulatory-like domain
MRGSMRGGIVQLIFGICLLFLAAPDRVIQAQSGATGALTVTVTDPTGGAIGGATVTVTNVGGVSRNLNTNDNGSCTFAQLPPGAYRVVISAAGFATIDVPSVTVNVAGTEVLNQSLKVGTQEQHMTVTTTTQTVQTETSTLGGVVGSQTMTDLPLVTRNFIHVLDLSPGVVASVNDASQLGRGVSNIYAGGSNNASNSFEMDGVNVTNYGSSSPGDTGLFGWIPTPSPDALQEFKVQTSSYDASYGRGSGANVNVVTKSGTNDWHGTVFEFLRNDDLNANGFFQNRNGRPRGALKQNQYGGTFGGAIRKDKLYYFTSYQGTRQVNGVAADGTSSVTLPAQLCAQVAADGTCTQGIPRTAAGLGAAFCPQNNMYVVNGVTTSTTYTFNPTAGAVNPAGDQVACDGSNINPVALGLMTAKLANGQYVIPTPQTVLNAGTATASGLSILSIPAHFRDDQILFNIDYLINPKNTLSLKYFWDEGLAISPFSSAGQPANGGDTGLSGNQLANAKLTTLLSNNLVNEVHFSSYYIRATMSSLVQTTTAELGITPATPSNPLMPTVAVTNPSFTNFGSGTNGIKQPEQIYEWSEELSWVHGPHTFRMGYDQQHLNWLVCSCGKSRGSLTFQTFPDLLLGMSAAQNGTSLSNIFNSNDSIQSWSSPNLFHGNLSYAYFQDDFKVNQRLTLNLGVRWEYDPSIYDTIPTGGTNTYWSLDQLVPVPPPGGTYAGFVVSKSYSGFVPPGVPRRNTNLLTNSHAPLNNFSPRFGFAWQPFSNTGKFVVRGGYGWFYNVTLGNAWTQTLIYTPPNAALFNYNSTANALATWADPFNPTVAPGLFSTYLRTTTSRLSERGTDPNLLTPMTQNWNLNIEYAVKPSWIITIGYNGSRSEHLLAPELLNLPQLATDGNPVNCDYPSGCITTNDTSGLGSPNNRVPVLGLVPGGFQLLTNSGDSHYDALQTSLRKIMGHGLQFQAAYTFGRSWSDVEGAVSLGGVGSTQNSNDPSNRRQQTAMDDWVRAQRLVLNYTYQFPAFHRDHGFAGRALSGWSTSGITTVQDGLPITITDSRGGAVYGFVGSSRAQLCPGSTYADVATPGSVQSRINGYLNASAFCTVPNTGAVGTDPGASGYGNTGRNIILGPGQFNFDMSLQKKTVIGGLREDASLEFRADFFNAFNHPQFSNPANSNVASPGTFGVITTTSVAPRILQFGLKYLF